jgi:hypothetical protein
MSMAQSISDFYKQAAMAKLEKRESWLSSTTQRSG